MTTIDVAWVREAGEFDVAGSRYEIRREPMWGAFVLRSAGREIARATKATFSRSFSVSTEGAEYTLRAASAFQRKFVLERDGVKLGEIRPRSMFSRKCVVQLGSDLPLPLRIFLLWLVIILWRRASNAAASS